MKKNNVQSQKTFDTACKMQRCGTFSAAVYQTLARKSSGRVGEILTRIAAEKQNDAEALQKYTGKKARASFLKVWLWQLLIATFGSSFVISCLEASVAKKHSAFTAISAEIPEATSICAHQEEHHAQLRELISQESQNDIGIAIGLYSVVLLLSASGGAFVFFKNPKAVAAVALSTGVASILAAAAVGCISQKSVAHLRFHQSAFKTAAAVAVTAVLLLAPFFIMSGLWSALLSSLCLALLLLALLSFFAAMTRQKTYRSIFAEIVLTSAGTLLIAVLAAWAVKAGFGLNAW